MTRGIVGVVVLAVGFVGAMFYAARTIYLAEAYRDHYGAFRNMMISCLAVIVGIVLAVIP